MPLDHSFPISDELHGHLRDLFTDPSTAVSERRLAELAPRVLAELPADGPPYMEAMQRLLECVQEVAFAGHADTVREAMRWLQPGDREVILANANGKARLTPLEEYADHRPAQPVLWFVEDENEEDIRSAILSVGEVAILSGSGGVGKSYVTAHIARHAVWNPPAGKPKRPLFGCLGVRAGTVVMVSYEDSAPRIYQRLRAMPGAVGDGIYVLEQPEPLYAADPRSRIIERSGHWQGLIDALNDVKPVLVIVDPVSAALEAPSMNDSGPVRAFMRGLQEMATVVNCGVLAIAHDTKASRDDAKGGGTPGGGAVAGSSAWFDAARGVLYMRRVRETERRHIQCVKASYGRPWWEIELAERYNHASGTFQGFVRA